MYERIDAEHVVHLSNGKAQFQKETPNDSQILEALSLEAIGFVQ